MWTAVTNAYAISLCAQVGGFGSKNGSSSTAAPSASGTGAPMGNGTVMTGSPVPFTGNAGSVQGYGWVVLMVLATGMAMIAG